MIGRPPDKTKKIIKPCKQCNKLFESYISNDRVFCSVKCRGEWHAGENNVMKKEVNKNKIKESWQDPVKREKHIEGMKESWKDLTRRENMSQAMIKLYEDPLERKKVRNQQLKRYEDPLEHEKTSETTKKYYDNPITHERLSAAQQGQDYDAGEWSGFARGNQLHLIPTNQCIHLNPLFEGCNQHHIMSGVIINIPVDLHRSIWHRMTNGNRKNENMKEINKLAFKYLLGLL